MSLLRFCVSGRWISDALAMGAGAVRTRKTKQYQIINRFKYFESCLNRLYVQKSARKTKGLAVLDRPINVKVWLWPSAFRS
jgi:hypothetical protein